MKLTHILLGKMKPKSHCRGIFVNSSSLILNPSRWWACELLENTGLECLISTKNSFESGKSICTGGKHKKHRDSIEEKHCVGSSQPSPLWVEEVDSDPVEVEHSEKSLVFMKIPRRSKSSGCQLAKELYLLPHWSEDPSLKLEPIIVVVLLPSFLFQKSFRFAVWPLISQAYLLPNHRDGCGLDLCIGWGLNDRQWVWL